MSLIIPTIFMSCLATIIGVLTQKVRTTAVVWFEKGGREKALRKMERQANGSGRVKRFELTQEGAEGNDLN